MRDTLNFLTELSQHNDRDWFTAHKDWYMACHARFVAFAEEYIARLSEVDAELTGLQAKDCIWRIYRDVRFSKDKHPYKEWFGVFPAAKGGKKSQHGGYYFHLQPGHCLFSGGIWNPSPELLKALRTEIEANSDEVEEIMSTPAWRQHFADFNTDNMLKKVPAGFDPNSAHADWLKRKSYTFTTLLTDEQVCAPDLPDRLTDIASAAQPMIAFLNYTFEQYGEFPSRCGR